MDLTNRRTGKDWERQVRHYLDSRGGVCFKTHDSEHTDFVRMTIDSHGFSVVEVVEAKTTRGSKFYPFAGARLKSQWAGYVYQMERIAKSGFPVVVRLVVKFRRGAHPLYWDKVFAQVSDVPHVISVKDAVKRGEDVENVENS